MGLASALSTALTGMSAAETTIDVVGNNVANSNTVGFKASQATFATQFLQTQGLGSGPTEANGGTNPRQVGLGVLTAEITPDFTQGTIEISSSPSDLAIQGDGFFIVEGNGGEVLYTRNGVFKTNSENQLVTTGGQRLLGFGVDEFFEIQNTTLEPISIPLGSAAVAKPTQNVFLEGTLTPIGDVATHAEILQSAVLIDGSYSFPTTAATPTLNGAGAMTGTYRYYVTYATTTGGPGAGVESRPSPLSSSLTVSGQQIQLTGVPTTTDAEWQPGLVRRIYRNENNGSTFYYVGEINNPLQTTFDDNTTDAALVLNPEIDLDGPKIRDDTLLTDVVVRDGTTYSNVFQDGELRFTPQKGGRNLGTKELTITSTGGTPTTVADFLEFMEEAIGIQTPPGDDAANPIPQSQSDSGLVNAGATILGNTGRIQIVSNNGVANRATIGLSSMQLTAAGSTDNVSLSFGSVQTAVGQGAITDFVVYDTLGVPLNVRVTAVLQERTGNSTVYRWFADSADNDPVTGSEIAVGTGLITFDGEGNLVSFTNNTVSIDRRNIASTSPLEFDLDFSQLSGLAASTATVAAARQDGSGPGTLSSFIIGEDGLIRGVFTNGVTRDLGQIRLARFANPTGLVQRGQNLYASGVNSGLPIEGDPGAQGIGTIISGAVELSNTDIGENLIDLILASTAYRGNARVIDASQRLVDELLNLRR